jgi:hypothetical protein
MTPDKFASADMPTFEPPPVQFAEIRQSVRRSDDVKELIAALIKAQIDFEPVLKDSENEAYSRGQKKSKYATLASVIDATRPALNKNGLTIVQHVQSHNSSKETIITTTLFHVSGQFLESDFTMPSVGQNGRFDPQTVASATTYGRRYAWLAITGAAPEDDDGNAASGVGTSKAAENVAKAKLEESAKSPDPKVAAIAKEGLAKINASATQGDLEGQLKRSLEAQKDEGLFDDLEGSILSVRKMSTSAAKGSRPYRKVNFGHGMGEIEMSLFEDFKLGDSTAFTVLDGAMPGDPARFLVEKNGKYTNIKDIKRIGPFHWEAGEQVIQRA